MNRFGLVKIGSLLLPLILLISQIVVQTGCANIVPPEGGFRDSIPPVLVKATPKDSTRNFQGNRINLAFDEYIDVENFQQNAIITPLLRRPLNETHKLNTISVKLSDSLDANTTYTINFGNSIKDINEGNVMKDFTYVFSTGPAIDSLTFSGNVLLAETGKTDTTLIVMLHRKSEDSAVVNERPRYITRLDGKGHFVFHNLPPGTFYAYALKDDTRQYLYRNNKSLFAFADSPIVVRQPTAPVTLYAYEEVKPTQTGIAAATGTQTTADRRLKFQTTARANKHDLLEPFTLRFDRSLKRFDSAKVHFSIDSAYTPVTDYSWTMDSTKKKVTLNYTWKENTLYHIILEKDFAADSLNQQLLRTDTITFKTMMSSDYGRVSVRFRNLDLSKNPVLLLVLNDQVVNSFPLTSETFSNNFLLPGLYDLRILNDTNKNGRWDPGQFFGKHIQPEIVKPVNRQLNIKPNWENELEINL